MPNDAKLGLVVGVGVVIATSVVFFHKDAVAAPKPKEEVKAAAIEPATAKPHRDAEAQPASRQNDTADNQPD